MVWQQYRKLLGFPPERSLIIDEFVRQIQTHFPNTEVIAGTATAGIPWAAWIAQKMNLPMLYVRTAAKMHGLKSQIEGNLITDSKCVLIEDFISTGKSSGAAWDICLSEKLDMASNFKYISISIKFCPC